MANGVYEVGRRIYKGTTAENTATVTPIATDAAIGIVLPAKPIGGGGPLECLIVVEGTGNSRWTINGVTPSATVGQLLVPGSGVSSLLLRGQEVIAAFKIFGAGNTMTYQFFTSDLR